MKKAKKIINQKSIAILFVMLFTFAFKIGAGGNVIVKAYADEEKQHDCTAKEEDGFAKNQIVVTMKDSAEPVKYYTVADFSELSLTVLEDLTKSVKEILKK